MSKSYVTKLLTNTQGQDASSIAVFENEDAKTADAPDRRDGISSYQSPGFSQHKDAFAFCCDFVHTVLQIFRIMVCQYKFRRSQNQRRAIIEGGG